jgi:hypothetical protein
MIKSAKIFKAGVFTFLVLIVFIFNFSTLHEGRNVAAQSGNCTCPDCRPFIQNEKILSDFIRQLIIDNADEESALLPPT